MKKILLRSMLYIPGYKEKYIYNSNNLGADAIIFDLEDSVPDMYKGIARKNINDYLENSTIAKKSYIFIRLNSIDSKLLFEDLKYVLLDKVDGFLLTKIYTKDDIIYYDKLFSQLENEHNFEDGKFKFIPMIETASAVLESYSIAGATKRNVALAFGGEDFLADISGFHGNPPKGLDYGRSYIAIAARSAGLVPIDTPYLKIKNTEGFLQEERKSFEVGFGGVQCLHPIQVELANKCFSPTDEELEEARTIVAAIEKSSSEGSGVAMYNGQMIGPPMERRAKKILAMADN